MLDIPGDMLGRYIGREAWRRSEDNQEEAPAVTREHLELCRGYALRTGKDLCVQSDRTKYFMVVMALRSKK